MSTEQSLSASVHLTDSSHVVTTPTSPSHLSLDEPEITITRDNLVHLLSHYGVRPLVSKIMGQHTSKPSQAAAATDALKVVVELSREVRELIEILAGVITGRDALDGYGSDWMGSGVQSEGEGSERGEGLQKDLAELLEAKLVIARQGEGNKESSV